MEKKFFNEDGFLSAPKPQKTFKKCKYCRKTFEVKRYKQEFCCKRHWEKWKVKNKPPKKFPLWKCPACHKYVQMEFDIRRGNRWEEFRCPFCGHRVCDDIDEERVAEEVEDDVMKILG
jgi:aspartate carbamoyltransferase regulatory subunit